MDDEQSVNKPAPEAGETEPAVSMQASDVAPATPGEGDQAHSSSPSGDPAANAAADGNEDEEDGDEEFVDAEDGVESSPVEDAESGRVDEDHVAAQESAEGTTASSGAVADGSNEQDAVSDEVAGGNSSSVQDGEDEDDGGGEEDDDDEDEDEEENDRRPKQRSWSSVSEDEREAADVDGKANKDGDDVSGPADNAADEESYSESEESDYSDESDGSDDSESDADSDGDKPVARRKRSENSDEKATPSEDNVRLTSRDWQKTVKEKPFLVPNSGDYFLHDNRFGDEDDDVVTLDDDRADLNDLPRQAAKDEETRRPLWDGTDEWAHDLYKEDEQGPIMDESEISRTVSPYGRGRRGSGGYRGNSYDHRWSSDHQSQERGGGAGGSARGGRGRRDYQSDQPRRGADNDGGSGRQRYSDSRHQQHGTGDGAGDYQAQSRANGRAEQQYDRRNSQHSDGSSGNATPTNSGPRTPVARRGIRRSHPGQSDGARAAASNSANSSPADEERLRQQQDVREQNRLRKVQKLQEQRGGGGREQRQDRAAPAPAKSRPQESSATGQASSMGSKERTARTPGTPSNANHSPEPTAAGGQREQPHVDQQQQQQKHDPNTGRPATSNQQRGKQGRGRGRPPANSQAQDASSRRPGGAPKEGAQRSTVASATQTAVRTATLNMKGSLSNAADEPADLEAATAVLDRLTLYQANRPGTVGATAAATATSAAAPSSGGGAKLKRYSTQRQTDNHPQQTPQLQPQEEQQEQQQQQRSLPAGVMIAENPPAVQAVATAAPLQPQQPQQPQQQAVEQFYSQRLQEQQILYQQEVMKRDQMMLNIQHQLAEAQQRAMHQEQILLQFASQQQQQQQQVPPPQQQQPQVPLTQVPQAAEQPVVARVVQPTAVATPQPMHMPGAGPADVQAPPTRAAAPQVAAPGLPHPPTEQQFVSHMPPTAPADANWYAAGGVPAPEAVFNRQYFDSTQPPHAVPGVQQPFPVYYGNAGTPQPPMMGTAAAQPAPAGLTAGAAAVPQQQRHRDRSSAVPIVDPATQIPINNSSAAS